MKILILSLVILIGINMPKPTMQKPAPPKQTVATQNPKGRHHPRFVDYANKPAPKGNKNTINKAEPMSDALRKLYERLDDWQYAGPLPYDTVYDGTKDPYPMPKFDMRKKAND